MTDYFFLQRYVVFTLADKRKGCDVIADDNGNLNSFEASGLDIFTRT